MERPATPKLLASFIEYAVADKVTAIEWGRFMVAHYADPRMEEARRECVRIRQLGGAATADDLNRLRSLADGLRSAN